MDRAPMEMLRLPREEQVFEREAVFGRDASSVFPNESKGPAADTEALKEAIGARKFISETELQELKKERNGELEPGSEFSGKSLAEVLAERKAQKEADFQEQWKKMKQGKNRPLDEEEAAWYDAKLREDYAKEQQLSEEERQGMEEYRQALQQADKASQERQAQVPAAPRPGSVAPAVKAKPVAKAIVRTVVRLRGQDTLNAAGTGVDGTSSLASPADMGERDRKRSKLDESIDKCATQETTADLAGLLGGYGTSSDADDA